MVDLISNTHVHIFFFVLITMNLKRIKILNWCQSLKMVKSTQRKSVQKIIKQFFKNTTIHACNFLTMEDISVYEKIFWAIVNIMTITATIVWIKFLWLWYLENPTLVNFDGTIPLEEIEHPGVAICNVNKISKRRAYEFAKELRPFLVDKNLTSIMEDIKLMGNLYDFNMMGQERFQKFQDILDKYDDKSDFYDPTARIFELATPCKEILLHCRFNNEDRPCEELFLTRMTFDGLCCVFNNVRPSGRLQLYKNRNVRNPPTESETCHGPGKTHGLEVVLNNDLDDYFYTSMETIGYKVHFFMCHDFPDELSGSLKEFLVGVGTQSLFSIEVDVIRSTPHVKSIPLRLRNCKFQTESNTSFGPYTQSDCFVECKLRSMQALCNCIPFLMPIEPTSSYKYRSVCSLIDIPCANQYSGKWSKYFPIGTEIEDLELEQHDSIHCDCPAMCNGVNYNIYTNSFPMEYKERNMSKLNIYFINSFGNLYKIDLSYTWFEVISAYGGLMSLVMGLSLVSIIEIFVLLCKLTYFFVYKLYSLK